MNAKRAEAAKPKKGDRSFISFLAVIAIAGLTIIGYVVFKPKTQATTVVDTSAPLPAAKGYVMGSESAPVEIVMYGDFECPLCGQFTVITEPDVRTRLVATGAARFRFMDYPIFQIHPATRDAHNAAACANAQNKFWDMHDRIFAAQHEWSTVANNRDMNAPKIFKRYAKELGLDANAFGDCLDSRQFEPQVRANLAEGERLGVRGTPTFIIGSRMMEPGSQPYDAIKALVDSVTRKAGK